MAVLPLASSWRRLRGLASTVALVGLLAGLAPAAASASIETIGSPLSVRATRNTAENLDYVGTFTPVPVSPEAPNGIFHTFHYGADTALWNVGQAKGLPRAPAAGQALKVRLEGCAQAAQNGPAPLTQIHFQSLEPVAGGGVKVNLTSQGFSIPICGQDGASGSTVTSYDPINLCLGGGDYVGFNDEGGYVENVYRAGVPYKVLGAVKHSTTDSFLKDEGTGNGSLLSSSVRAANEGFASNKGEELMMQVTFATGSDATHICAGGTAGRPRPLAPLRVSRQTDGINRESVVAVAMYCRRKPRCRGVATMSLDGRTPLGSSSFSLRPHVTTHLPIRLGSNVIGLIRKDHGVSTTLTAVVDGKTITQHISVKII
jgi:hypothetical protein